MKSHKIFISYSRANKLYVSSLAVAFREEGFTVWFDSDIKTGEEWDNTIEREIKNADAMVLVLSETSVASDNVKDEMSYAMSMDKPLNPIKIEECNVPMRLARKQYIDFTKLGHERGFEKLIEDIKYQLKISPLEQGSARKTVFKPAEDPKSGENRPVETSKTETPTPKPKETTAFKNSNKESLSLKKSKLPFILGGLLLLMVAAIFLAPKLFTNEDKTAFERAVTINTIASFEEYRANFPHGKYLGFTLDSIEYKQTRKDRTDSLNLIRIEEKDWMTAQAGGSLDDFIFFLKKHENGKHAKEANTQRAALETSAAATARDEAIWNRTKGSRSITPYLNYYMDNSITGIHKDEAIEYVQNNGREVYLFYGRTKDNIISKSSVFDVVCCGEAPLNHDKKPVKGDILLTERNINVYLDRHRKQSFGTISKGAKVLVDDVIMEGQTAIIVKIIISRR